MNSNLNDAVLKRTRTSDVESAHAAKRRKTACQSCRIRKVKCDGSRPVCGICETVDSICEYTDPLAEKLR